MIQTVTDQIFLLGLDEAYRFRIKMKESKELLECAKSVTSDLGVQEDPGPVEGYYHETPELTQYFRLIRALQGQSVDRSSDIADKASFERLLAVTQSRIYGIRPSDDQLLLPTGVDALSLALQQTEPNWQLDTLINAAFDLAQSEDDYSLVGLGALSKNPVCLAALRESVVLYAAAVDIEAYEPEEPEYVWKVNPQLETAAQKFVADFNALFEENIPKPCAEAAQYYYDASDSSDIYGRCVRLGSDSNVMPVRYYHWAITVKDHAFCVEDFWDTKLWTTQDYKEKLRNS